MGLGFHDRERNAIDIWHDVRYALPLIVRELVVHGLIGLGSPSKKQHLLGYFTADGVLSSLLVTVPAGALVTVGTSPRPRAIPGAIH